MTQGIYLDHNATTPVATEVLDAMLPWLGPEFGNPSSESPPGRRARAAVEAARAEVAALIGAEADEVFFTGGGTEASNIAIRGVPLRAGSVIVTSAIEHPATEACCTLLEAGGRRVRRVTPCGDGAIRVEDAAAAIDREVGLVTLIHAQNETGTIQPVAAVAALARKAGAVMHADAAQSLGKVPVDVRALGVDLLSVAGHKLYAPKGVGALYVRRGIGIGPVLVGAGQERGLRPGTENVPYIVGLGAACRIAREGLTESARRIGELSARLLARLRAEVPGLVLVGETAERLPNTLNVLFPGVSGRELLGACGRVMASNGSACHAGSEAPSAVLLALGIVPSAALGAVRLSLGRRTTEDDVDAAAADLAAAWERLKNNASEEMPE